MESIKELIKKLNRLLNKQEKEYSPARQTKISYYLKQLSTNLKLYLKKE